MAQYKYMCKMSMEFNRAFDGSGFSECSRQFKYTIDPICEVLQVYIYNMNRKVIGSTAEGTHLWDSDIDFLMFDQTGVKVGYNPEEAGTDSDQPYLRLTRGPLTPAGYTNLQIYLNGKECCDNEENTLQSVFINEIVRYNPHAMFLTNRKPTKIFQEFDMTVHGPAQTIQFNNAKTLDQVIAYESKIIPVDMNSWFERTRLKSWPSKTTCELFKSIGCCYVGVGHSKSPEQDFEWRISPTRQELYLMLNLNQTQFRCYILLKMIKKSIHTMCGDSISSYHCKTALFWTIENTEQNIWQPHNLIECVFKCLKLLLVWVTEKKCPNYFFSEENMFETKIMNKIHIDTWQEVINSFFPICSQLLLPVIIRRYKKIAAIIESTIEIKKGLSETTYGASTITEHAFQTCQQYIELIKTKPRNECIQKFQDLVNPHRIDIDILLEILVEKQFCLNRKFHLKSLLEGNKFTEKYITAHLNDTSKKSLIDYKYFLKLASIAVTRGAYSTCDVLLQNVHRMTKLDIYCRCYISFQREETLLLVRNNIYENTRLATQFINQLSISDVLHRFSFCLQFYDSENEAGIVKPPCHFDAHKTVGIPSKILTAKFKNVIRNMIALISIHPVVYLHFLQYKNSEMMNKNGDMCVALEKLEHMNLVGLQKGIYSHPDTTLNLLGHIYMTKGWYRLAIKCFRRSWRMQPYYNAVKWHVIIMLF